MQRRDVPVSTIVGDAVGVGAAGSAPSRVGMRSRRRKIRAPDGIFLFHREWGSGQPLLLVHSLSLSSAMWSYQETFLADHGIRCISYDRRGHGRSDGSTPGLDLDTFADDLAAVIESLELRDLVLAGHSVGCGEIIRYMARHGTGRIAKVIMLAPTTPCVVQGANNPYGAPPTYFHAMRAAWAADYPKWLQENRAAFFTPDTSPQMMDWIQLELVRSHVPTVIAYHRAYVETDLRPDLAKVDRPVLILHGDNDVSAPLEITGRRTAMGIASALLKVYPGAPHGLFVTHMDQVNRDMLEFIKA